MGKFIPIHVSIEISLRETSSSGVIKTNYIFDVKSLMGFGFMEYILNNIKRDPLCYLPAYMKHKIEDMIEYVEFHNPKK